MPKTAKIEDPADEVKKLAVRNKALEAELRQTISKKEHHEIVLEFEDKMTAMEKKIAAQETKIAEQEKELTRTKADLQKAGVLNKNLAEVGDQVEVLNRMLDSQGRAVDSIVSRIVQGTVPIAVHQHSLSKVSELEGRIEDMVSKSEFAALQKRYDEATRKISGMVPAADHEALKERVDELETSLSSMVPRDQFEASEATVKELEEKLSDRVPQSTYDELVSKVVQLAGEITGGQALTEEPETPEQSEPAQPEPQASAEEGPASPPEVPAQPAPLQEEVTAGDVATEGQPEPEAPEIREVGSQLAEVNAEAATEPQQGEGTQAETAPEPEAGEPVQDAQEEKEIAQTVEVQETPQAESVQSA